MLLQAEGCVNFVCTALGTAGVDAGERQSLEQNKLQLSAMQEELANVLEQVEALAGKRRIERLRLAVQILEQERDDMQRMLAAIVATRDGPSLVLAEARRNTETDDAARQKTKSIATEQSLGEAQRLLEQARRSGEFEMKLADQLNCGITWWLRGRFGWGDALAGMGKSAASMSASPHNLAWQGYATAAPSEDGESSYYMSPRLPRRHHYYWTISEVVKYPPSRTPTRRRAATPESPKPTAPPRASGGTSPTSAPRWQGNGRRLRIRRARPPDAIHFGRSRK